MANKKSILSKKDGFKYDYDYIDRLNDQMEQRETGLKEISLNKIKIKKNIRISYEKIEEMADSIKEKGLLQPITITPTKEGYFDIVFGHRRYKAYCLLNEQEPEKYLKIQAIVIEKDTLNDDEIREIQLIENIQRDNLKPLELKDALEYFRNKGMSNKDIAKKLGKKEGYVKQIFSTIKAINQNTELEALMISDPGVTLKDIQVIKILPFKEQIKLISEKAKGNIKTRKELQEKVFALKENNYIKSKAGRDIRNAHGCFILGKNSLKIRLNEIDSASDIQRNELVGTLKGLVKKIEDIKC
jgi:ParB/RepB/Spo0J family partition protein